MYKQNGFEPEVVGAKVPRLVILVHGTWSRGMLPFLRSPLAAWCKPGSRIRKSIEKTLGADNLIFEIVSWSGSNSVGARLSATRVLKRRLTELREKHPRSPIYIVTHSHGGNVAMYCLRTKGARVRVRGLVCMSTPFLIVRPRALGKHFGRKIRASAFALVAVVAVALIVSALVQPTRPLTDVENRIDERQQLEALFSLRKASAEDASIRPRDEDPPAMAHARAEAVLAKQTARKESLRRNPYVEQPTSIRRTVNGVLRFGAILGVIAAVYGFVGYCLERIKRWNRRFARKLALPSQLPFPVLIIRNVSDEASGVLASSQFLTWLTTSAIRFFAALLPNVKSTWRTMYWSGPFVFLTTSIAIIGFIGAVVCLKLPAPDVHGFNVGWLVAGGSVLAFVAPILLPFLAIPLIWALVLLQALILAPFGLRHSLAAFSLQISAEETPPGLWQVCQVASPPQNFDEGHGLQHATYDNKIALEKLDAWINDCEKNA
jgi:pimeloyl-ACP methyl ester carboxylesterase